MKKEEEFEEKKYEDENEVNDVDISTEEQDSSTQDDNEEIKDQEEDDDIDREEAETEEEKLQAQIEELKNNVLRERADFMNYRKRAIEEKIESESRITGRILTDLLPVFDTFDQFFSTMKNTDDKKETDESVQKITEGVLLIQKQLWNVFETLGVESINPENAEFDPKFMEALSVNESDEVDKETVETVYQKGYQINDKVLRAARVAVIKPIAKKKKEKK